MLFAKKWSLTVGKRKEEKFEFKKKEWQENLVSRVLEDIEKSKFQFLAVGLDMAASEENWGLSIIGLKEGLAKGDGELILLLPHREPVSGFRAPCPMKASQDFLVKLLESIGNKTIAIAVDVPLGWPRKHGAFTNSWSAKNGLDEQVISPSREEFEFRLTDIKLRNLLRQTDQSASVFSVGADKIASAAFKWAEFRMHNSNLNLISDVGFSEKSPKAINLFETYPVSEFGFRGEPPKAIYLFETYPAAYVRLNYPGYIQYKSSSKSEKQTNNGLHETRLLLFKRLVEDYGLLVEGRQKDHLDQAYSSPRSDAFDGLLSAMSAWDYLLWKKNGPNSLSMTAPDQILGHEIDFENSGNLELIKQIESEGWILVRSSPLNNPNGGQT